MILFAAILLLGATISWVTLKAIATAPEGQEDGLGFHFTPDSERALKVMKQRRVDLTGMAGPSSAQIG
jgi:hypothetical protein